MLNTFIEREAVNLGQSTAPYTPAIAIGGFLAPAAYSTLTAAEVADMATTLAAKLHHNDPKQRWQILPAFESMEDLSETATIQTLEYSKRKIVTDRGYCGVKYGMIDGGKDIANKLIKLNGLQEYFKYYEVDLNNVLIGTQTDETGKVCDGLSLSMLFTEDMKRPTSGSVAQYMINLGFDDPAEQNENIYAIKLPDTVKYRKLKGVQDLIIKYVGDGTEADGVFPVEVYAGGGNVNLAKDPTLAAALANQARWTVTTEDGDDITLTGAPLNATKTAFDITCDTADPQFTNGVIGYITVKDVATLAAAGLKYFTHPDPYACKVTFSE
jgi:hypothetical protein